MLLVLLLSISLCFAAENSVENEKNPLKDKYGFGQTGGCQQSMPAILGGSCCPGTGAQYDTMGPKTYLQCATTDAGATAGVWVRMTCPSNTVFNIQLQICTSPSVVSQGASTAYNSGTRRQPVPYTYQQNTVQSYQPQTAPVYQPQTLTNPVQTYAPAPTYQQGTVRQQSFACPGVGLQVSTTPCTAYGNACPTGQFCQMGIRICCPSTQTSQTCSNGMPSLSQTCSGNINCPQNYLCDPTIRKCCPQATPVTPAPSLKCPSGSDPVGYCFTDQTCGTKFNCITASNLCCPSSATKCPDGSDPAAQCIGGQCGLGYTCSSGNVCCLASAQTCADGAPSEGPCINGLCTAGYTCTNNICCRSQTLTCPLGATAIGPCINGLCPFSFECYNNVACCAGSQVVPVTPVTPVVTPFPVTPGTGGSGVCPDLSRPEGPCIQGLCSIGHQCLNGVCCKTGGNQGLCPDGAVPSGPCMAGLCANSWVCSVGNICCPPGNRRKKPTAIGTQIGNPLLPSPHAKCPNGNFPVGKCIGGLCPLRYACHGASNLCCPKNHQSRTKNIRKTQRGRGGPSLADCMPNGFVDPRGRWVRECTNEHPCPAPYNCFDGRCCQSQSARYELDNLYDVGIMEDAVTSERKAVEILGIPSADYFGWSSNCSQPYDCNFETREWCVQGMCIPLLPPGAVGCLHDIQCRAACAASECAKDSNTGRRQCQCSKGTVLFRDRCLQKCPQGVSLLSDKECDPSPTAEFPANATLDTLLHNLEVC